jgi:hypothetical protein
MSTVKAQMTNEIQISKLKIQMEQSLGGGKTSSERECIFFRSDCSSIRGETRCPRAKFAGEVGYPSRVSEIAFLKRWLPGFPGGTLKNFGKPFSVKRNGCKSKCLSPEGEFWICSEANSRMVHNSFQ